MVQFCEVVIPYTTESIFETVKKILLKMDDPFRIFISLSMLCTHGKDFISISF